MAENGTFIKINCVNRYHVEKRKFPTHTFNQTNRRAMGAAILDFSEVVRRVQRQTKFTCAYYVTPMSKHGNGMAVYSLRLYCRALPARSAHARGTALGRLYIV